MFNNVRTVYVPASIKGALLLVCCTLLLASCDGERVGLSAEESPGNSSSGNSSSSNSSSGNSSSGNSEDLSSASVFDEIDSDNFGGDFGDVFWSELAQSYPAFIPEPGLGAAHGPEENIVLGRWGDVIEFPLIATGAANLADGKILIWASTQEDFFGGEEDFTHGYIFDPVTLTFEENNNTVHNAFCAGVSLLPDGSVFAAGGGATITTTSIFDDGEWSLSNDLQTPRWYPTSTTLPSGQVLVTLGTTLNGESELWTDGLGYETAFKLDLSTILSDDTAQMGTHSWYPAVNVAPDGTLFHPGPTNQMLTLDLHTDNGVTHHGDRENEDFHRLYNSTVMYDVGKLLMAGGGSPSAQTAMIIDLNGGAPLVTPTNPMNFARTFQNSIVLPNGEVLSIGGNTSGITFSDQGTIVTPEIWNPDTQQWTALAPHTYPRNYHSTAMLLKDGRVVSMGGGLCGECLTNQQNGEIFEPPYLFNSDGTLAQRPEIIQTEENVLPGDTIVVSGSDDIEEFSFLRLAALTHHHSTDQRRIPLSFEKTGAGTYEVTLPVNANVLIPGNYWLFGLNAAGVPSVGYSVVVDVVENNITGISELNANTALLTYEYFEPAGQTVWNALPDFDALTPVESGFAASFSLTQALREDNFGFRYQGRIEIEQAGEYVFFLTSDDGSRLFINDQLVIDHDGIHAPTEEVGTLFLAAGQHDLRVEYFEADGGNSLSVEIAGDNTQRQSVAAFLLPIAAASANAETLVEYEYFEGNWSALPEFDSLVPVKTGIQGDFSIADADRADNFAFRFTTRLLAETAGNYTFFTRSDDGSQLFVNGNLVVNNDGLHPPRDAEGTVNLPVGWHDVVVTFFEGSVGEVLAVEIQRPNGTREAFNTHVQSVQPNQGNQGNGNAPVSNGGDAPENNGGNANPNPVAYEYYEGFWNSLPDFDSLTPLAVGDLATISLTPRQRDDNFAFRFTTEFTADVDGAYTFYSTSDDGSQVAINGVTVVDNNGRHPAIEAQGTINLAAGQHELVVTFFESGGGETLVVEFEGPQSSRQVFVPAGSGNTTNNGNPAGTGVDYAYYEGNWNVLPDFNALVPLQTGNINTLSLAPATANDFFGFRFTFNIEIATAGQYTFHSSSDDGSQVWVNGQMVVNNDGLHPMIEVAGTTTLAAGTHQVVVNYFEKAGGQGLRVDVTNPTGVRQSINSYLPSDPAATPAEPIVGVEYDYYEGSWNALPDFNALLALDSGTLTDISLSPATAADNFALRFNASLQIQTPGAYTFHLTSDDGSLLAIDGSVVVDNDGLHGAIEASGTAVLTAGVHDITVSYFERTGLQTLIAEVTDPAGVRQPLSSLFYVAPVNVPVTPPAALQVTTPATPPATMAAAMPANLITNGDFEADIAGWENCGVEASSNVFDVATGGSQLIVENGGCRFQEIPVNVGDTLILSCEASNDGTGFSSFALTLQDAAFLPLLTSEVSIPTGPLQSQSTALVVPLGVTTGVVTFYSEAFSAFDNCSLAVN